MVILVKAGWEKDSRLLAPKRDMVLRGVQDCVGYGVALGWLFGKVDKIGFLLTQSLERENGIYVSSVLLFVHNKVK